MVFPPWIPKVKQIIQFETIGIGEHKFTECEVLSRTKVIEKGKSEYAIFTSLGDMLFTDGKEWFLIDRSELNSEPEEYHSISIKKMTLVA